MGSIELKKLWKEYTTAKNESDKLDLEWAKDPENEELEKAWDKAYKEQYTAFENLVNGLNKFSNIDTKTLREMIIKYEERIGYFITHLQ